jgi:hypothetical protein
VSDLKSIIFEIPFFDWASDLTLGVNVFPSSRSRPELMFRVYRERPIAKMTGLPDNLTETPQLHADAAIRWTFSTKS